MSKNDVNFIAFCDELRAYVEEHHYEWKLGIRDFWILGGVSDFGLSS